MTGFASLIEELDPRQDPPQELLDLLGSVLRARMVELELWDQPPEKLGYDQFPSWSEPAAFGQLLGTCYEACIRSRFAALSRRSAGRNGSIDSQVTHRIDQFLVNFTNLIRQLDPDVEPPLEVIKRLLDLLGKGLRKQLKKSNFWHQSPMKLGIHAAGGGWRESEAMNELIHEGYCRCIATRLDRLRSAIADGREIDGIVHTEIGRLIIDRWRTHSRHEYRLFKNPEAVVRSLARAGQVHVFPRRKTRHGSISLKPESVVSFSAGPVQPPVALELILDALRDSPHWTRDVARLIGKKRAQEVIEAALYRLHHRGVLCFRFGDLCGALRSEFESEIGFPRMVQTPPGFDVGGGQDPAPQGALWDTRAVHRAIDESAYQRKVRDGLHAIETIQHEAVQDGEMPPGPKQLSRRLGIPTQTASDYNLRLQAIRVKVYLGQ